MESWPAAAVPDLPGQAPETKIWDTASGGIAVAAPDRRALLYACGITPYDATHLGHAATYVAWDLLVRAWHDAWHEVTYVQNVTDVDDPLLDQQTVVVAFTSFVGVQGFAVAQRPLTLSLARCHCQRFPSRLPPSGGLRIL